jgi:hypothetical protein
MVSIPRGTQSNRGRRPLETPGRLFGLGDGLILVTATAVGLAAIRVAMTNDMYHLAAPTKGWSSISATAEFVADFALWVVAPLLGAWTLACLVLLLRPPRPAFRRLLRRPGALTCLVAAILVLFTPAVGIVASRTVPYSYLSVYASLLFGSIHAGAGAASCWTTLLLWRRWRPEPTWLDRLGRLIGAAWMSIAVLVELPPILQ